MRYTQFVEYFRASPHTTGDRHIEGPYKVYNLRQDRLRQDAVIAPFNRNPGDGLSNFCLEGSEKMISGRKDIITKQLGTVKHLAHDLADSRSETVSRNDRSRYLFTMSTSFGRLRLGVTLEQKVDRWSDLVTAGEAAFPF